MTNESTGDVKFEHEEYPQIHFMSLNSIPAEYNVAPVDRGLKAEMGRWRIACQPGVRERINATMFCEAVWPWDPLILTKRGPQEEEEEEEQAGISDRWTLMS